MSLVGQNSNNVGLGTIKVSYAQISTPGRDGAHYSSSPDHL